MVCEILEGIEDNQKAALISLDQPKAFERANLQFLVTVLDTVGFETEFRRWISQQQWYK